MPDHCNHTNAIGAVPWPDKTTASMKHAAVELVRFCQLLGHTEVEFRCDQERSMLQLQGLAMNARKRLGFQTRIRNPPVGDHQANGFAEKSIDVIRSFANVFLDSARHTYKIEVPVSHPLLRGLACTQHGSTPDSRSRPDSLRTRKLLDISKSLLLLKSPCLHTSADAERQSQMGHECVPHQISDQRHVPTGSRHLQQNPALGARQEVGRITCRCTMELPPRGIEH